MKAKGFVERSGMVVAGGLPGAEMPLLTSRRAALARRAGPARHRGRTRRRGTPETGREAEPPGRGKFLIKVGGRPGIPVRVELTESERAINDTNKLWHDQSRESAGRTGIGWRTLRKSRTSLRRSPVPRPRQRGQCERIEPPQPERPRRQTILLIVVLALVAMASACSGWP